MCAFLTIKAEFENQLHQLLGVKKERTLLMTDDRYNELVLETKEAIERRSFGLELSGLHYRRLKRFDIITIDGCDKLVQRNENGQGLPTKKLLHYCMARDMFEAIHEAHLRIGHKKEKGMELELKKMYCNITREVIAIYLKLCQTCALKRKYKNKSSSAKVDALPDDSTSRCQIDVIDMKVETDQGFRFVLNFEDHLTKFLILRPLRTNSAEEVADILFDIFCLIGVPNVLMCSNEYGFCEKILRNLSKYWNVNLVRGEFKEDTIQRVSQEIFKTITDWMSHNDSNNWIFRLRIIQSSKNRCFNPSIKRTPFEALFGNRQSNSLLDHQCNFELKTEDDLKLKIEVFKQKLNQNTEICTELSKSHEGVLQKNCNEIVEPSIRCLNCGNQLTLEVFCWRCNGPLHFNCALTNDNSENPFCQVCASKTAVLTEVLVHQKRKLEEFDQNGFDLKQKQRCPSFDLDECGNFENLKINNNRNILYDQVLGNVKQSKRKYNTIRLQGE